MKVGNGDGNLGIMDFDGLDMEDLHVNKMRYNARLIKQRDMVSHVVLAYVGWRAVTA